MKRLLTMMLGAALAFASCQKSELDGVSDGGVVDVTLSASMSGASATTRSGEGTTVDRCILEVYTGGTLYKRMVTEVENLEASFDLRLVSSQTYEFLLWADKDADAENTSTTEESIDYSAVGEKDKYYTTTNSLKNITLNSYYSYDGNNEERDAFYYKETKEIKASTVIDALLKRPFGQLNVYTDLTDVRSDMLPAAILIESDTKLYDGFDVSTEVATASGNNTFSWTNYQPVLAESATIEKDAKGILLSTDYLFVSNGTEQNLYDFKMTFYSSATNTSSVINTNDNFKSIPVQRNYKTNVSGELLTKAGTVNVEIVDEFDGEIEKQITDISDVASLNTALSDNATADEKSYAISGEITEATQVNIPTTTNTGETSRSFEFVDGIADNVTLTITDETIAGATDTNSIDVVYITVPTTSAGTISVNLPNSTVYINGTVFGGDVWTADQTLVINAGATVTNLTINAGNVDVYGTLTGTVNLGTSGITSATVRVIGDAASIEGANFGEGITYGYYNNSSMAILNSTTSKSYKSTDLLLAIEEAASGDVITLAADTEYWYTSPEDFNPDTASTKVLSITKDLTITSTGGAVIVPNYVTGTSNGNGAIQSTFFIEGGATVTFSGLTLMSHIYQKTSSSLVNKLVEVQDGATFNMVNCTTTKNTYVAKDGGYYAPTGSGGIYGNESATINITGSTLNNSSLSAGNLDSGTFTVKNTIFDNSFVSTPSWDKTFDPQASTMVINIDGCTFQNWSKGYTGSIEDTSMVRAAYGTINITNTTFPDDDKEYWSCPNTTSYYPETGVVWGGKISVDKIWYYPDYYNITTSTSYADFDTLYAGISSDYDNPSEIYITAGEYDLGYSFGKSVIVYGPNKDLHGASTERKAEAVFKNHFYCSPQGGKSLTLGLYGVTLTEKAAFEFQGGCNVTLKNSIFSSGDAEAEANKSGRIYYTNGKQASSVIVLEDNLFKATDGELSEIYIYGNVTEGPSAVDYVDLTITGNVFDNTTINIGTSYADDQTLTGSKFSVTYNTFRNIKGKFTMYSDGSEDARAILFRTASAYCPIATLTVANNTFEDTVSYPFTYIDKWTLTGSAPYAYDVVNATFSNNVDGTGATILTNYNRTVTTVQ